MVRLALIDDEVIWRETVQAWAAPEAGCTVSYYTTVANYTADHPAEVVCLDYRLADGSRAVDNVTQLVAEGNSVLILTSGASRTELESCIRAGALGVVLKGDGADTLMRTVDAIRHGSIDLSQPFAEALRLHPSAPTDPVEARLVQLVAMGVDVPTAVERVGWTQPLYLRFLRRLRVSLEDAVAPPAPQRLRIGAVDDHPIFLDGVERSLERYLATPMVCRARNVEELIQFGLPFDAVILDVVLRDGREPVENVRALVEKGWPVVLLTGIEPSAPAEIDQVCNALEAGARALVIKGDGGKELATAIAHALRGETYVNAAWARAYSTRHDQLELLTPREREVFHLRRLDMSRREIAERLYITEETVKTHVTSIGVKIGPEP